MTRGDARERAAASINNKPSRIEAQPRYHAGCLRQEKALVGNKNEKDGDGGAGEKLIINLCKVLCWALSCVVYYKHKIIQHHNYFQVTDE